MKILLINPITYPSIDSFVADSKKMKINSDEPIGLMYISSYIKKMLPDIEVEIFDWHLESLATNLTPENVLRQKIDTFSPDVVGISMLYEYNANISIEVANIVKGINEEIITVAGGIYATMQSYIKNIDYIIKGEGEIKFCNLICNLMNNTARRCDRYIRELDTLPFPDRSTIRIGEYGILGRTLVDRIYKKNCRVATIQVSRGCSCRCTYCSGHVISDRNYRKRSINSIVEEVKYLKQFYNIEVFIFNEENPNLSLRFTKELYKALIPLDIKWVSNAGFYVSNMDKEFITLAMKSGLLMWNLAFESGSKRLLRVLKKPIKIVENARQVLKWIREIDNEIYINSFWMFGFADETWDDVKKSIKLMKKLDCDWFQINFLQVFKGTELYDSYKAGGYIGDNNREAHYLSSTIKNSVIDPKELSDYVYEKVNTDLNFKHNRCVRIGNYAQAMRDMDHVLTITDGKHEWANKIKNKVMQGG